MTNKISYLDDGDICVLTKIQLIFMMSKKIKLIKKFYALSDDKNISEKGDYKNFMSKEIFEQPITVKNCINEYVDNLRDDINFYNFPIKPEEIRKIILIGCGTAYHSCLVAKYWFEELTSVDVETDIASEFRYRNLKFNKKNLIYICFSIWRNS